MLELTKLWTLVDKELCVCVCQALSPGTKWVVWEEGESEVVDS